MLMTFHLTVTLLAGLAASGQARSLKVGHPPQTAGIFDPWDYDYTYGDPTFHYDGVPERETTAREVDRPVIRQDPEPQEGDQGRQGVDTLNDPYDYSYTYGDYMMDYEVALPARDDPHPPGGAIPGADDHFIGSSPPHDNRDHSPSQPEGVDEEGVDEEGVDEEGVGQEGVDEEGVGQEGVDEKGVGQEGVDEEGVGQEGVDEEGVGQEGVDEEGVDEEGVDEEGVDEEGVDENSSISRLLQWLQDQLRNTKRTTTHMMEKLEEVRESISNFLYQLKETVEMGKAYCVQRARALSLDIQSRGRKALDKLLQQLHQKNENVVELFRLLGIKVQEWLGLRQRERHRTTSRTSPRWDDGDAVVVHDSLEGNAMERSDIRMAPNFFQDAAVSGQLYQLLREGLLTEEELDALMNAP